MKNKLMQIFRQGIIYGLGNTSQQLVSIILLPIYVTRLSTEEFGLLAMFQTIAALLNVILGMRFSTTLFRFFFDKTENRKLIVSSSFILLSGIGFFTILFVWLTAGTLSEITFKTDQYAEHFRFIALTLALELFKIIPMAVLRAQKRALHYAILVSALFFVGLISNIYVVVVLGKGVLGILAANTFTALLFVIIGLGLCHEFIGFTFSKQVIVEMIKYTLPLVPSSIFSYILQRSDRFFLQIYSTLSVIGIYSLGYRIGGLVNMAVSQPFQLIWMPTAFDLNKKGEFKTFSQRILTYIFLLSLWVGLGVSLFCKEALLIINRPDYYQAIIIVPWIVLAYIFESAYFVVNMGIYLKDKTFYSIWIVGLSALSNILLNFILIPKYDDIGAAIATFISYFLMFLFAWFINQKILPLKYEWERIIKVFVVFISLLACGLLFPVQNMVFSLIFKLFLVIAYWVLLYIIGFYYPKEILYVKEMISNLLLRLGFRLQRS